MQILYLKHIFQHVQIILVFVFQSIFLRIHKLSNLLQWRLKNRVTIAGHNMVRRFKDRIPCDISHGFSNVCDISHGRCDISPEDGSMRYIASKRGPIQKQTRTLFTLV